MPPSRVPPSRAVADPQSILITGASSGIGEALALAYAAPGVTLHISGRNPARIAAVAEACRGKGAVAAGRAIDVTDAAAMAAWIADTDAERPLDLIIANAGISNSTAGDGDADVRTRRIFAINVDGVVNTVLPALKVMQARRCGQIALVASVAGFRGLPTSAAYSASKAAIKNWGEALRGEHRDSGIAVNVICPGWVTSRITDANTFSMPLIMPAERAAAVIKRGLAADKARIVFPWIMYVAAWLLAALPPAWTDPILVRQIAARKD